MSGEESSQIVSTMDNAFAATVNARMCGPSKLDF